MALEWFGDKLIERMRDASIKGVNKTMSESVIQGKNNHPGFHNVTGTAEGSIQIAQFAEVRGESIVGLWGSINVDYFIWLELKRGAPLRTAADAIYPRLAGHIKEYFAA